MQNAPLGYSTVSYLWHPLASTQVQGCAHMHTEIFHICVQLTTYILSPIMQWLRHPRYMGSRPSKLLFRSELSRLVELKQGPVWRNAEHSCLPWICKILTLSCVSALFHVESTVLSMVCNWGEGVGVEEDVCCLWNSWIYLLGHFPNWFYLNFSMSHLGQATECTWKRGDKSK